MAWFFIGLVALGVVLLVVRGLLGIEPKRLARLLRWAGLVALGAAALYTALSGRFFLSVPLVLAAIWLWQRWLRTAPPARAPGGAGDSSRVETPFLSMALDHASGAITGEVRQGRFAGRRVQDLDVADIGALIEECRPSDPEAVRLLEAYLDRIAGAGWRTDSGADAEAEKPAAAGGAMTREEAYQVLGLKSGATAEQIKDAHRKLMQKLHPDLGGSNYLAAKINQAKQFLLGS